MFANAHRDPKKRPKAFEISDFLLFDDTVSNEDKKEGMSKVEMLSMRTHIGMMIKGTRRNQNKSKNMNSK